MRNPKNKNMTIPQQMNTIFNKKQTKMRVHLNKIIEIPVHVKGPTVLK